LSGQTHYFNTDSDQWIALSNNPISTANAHGHNKNHPPGLDATKTCFAQFDKQHGQLFSVYPVLHPFDIPAGETHVHLTHTLVSDSWGTVRQKRQEDYLEIINYCNAHNAKVVYIALDPSVVLYFSSARRAPRPGNTNDNHPIDSVFFKNSVDKWEDLNLTNRWDIRERRALDLRPYEHVWHNFPLKNTIFKQSHAWVDSRELWHNGPRTLTQLMDYLELKIDRDRWQAWGLIYQSWQAIQLEILDFVYRCDHIVNAIINNWYYDIGDLTLDQEAIIQHCLIYKHGVNLKTWQLTKFPRNAQDVHALLEPNIHIIESLY
jgi:hypothetical protein